MTALVILFIGAVIVMGGSGSKAGKWAGSVTAILAAGGIVGLAVAGAAGVLP